MAKKFPMPPKGKKPPPGRYPVKAHSRASKPKPSDQPSVLAPAVGESDGDADDNNYTPYQGGPPPGGQI